MHASYSLTTFDILKFNLYMLPRAKANYKIWLVLSIIFFMPLPSAVFSEQPFSLLLLLITVLGALLLGLIPLLLLSLYSIIVSTYLYAKSHRKKELLTVSLSEAGVTSDGSNAEGLMCWSTIDEIKLLKPYILFRFGLLYQIIPKNSFATTQECEAFITFAKQHLSAVKAQKSEGEGCIIIQKETHDKTALFQFSTDLQRKDTYDYVMAFYHKTKMLYIMFIAIFILILLLTGDTSTPWHSISIALVLSLTFFALIMGLTAILLFFGSKQSSKLYNFGDISYYITEDGFSYQSTVNEGEISWSGITKVELYPNLIAIKLGITLTIFPKRSFANDEDFQQCSTFLLQHWQAAQSGHKSKDKEDLA